MIGQLGGEDDLTRPRQTAHGSIPSNDPKKRTNKRVGHFCNARNCNKIVSLTMFSVTKEEIRALSFLRP